MALDSNCLSHFKTVFRSSDIKKNHIFPDDFGLHRCEKKLRRLPLKQTAPHGFDNGFQPSESKAIAALPAT